jgi:hypothetical protein
LVFFQIAVDFIRIQKICRKGVSLSLHCWWEKPLVVALKHSEGIKHTVLFQEQKLTNTKSLTIHALSLSL